MVRPYVDDIKKDCMTEAPQCTPTLMISIKRLHDGRTVVRPYNDDWRILKISVKM